MGQNGETLFAWPAAPSDQGRTSMELIRLTDPMNDKRSCSLSVRLLQGVESGPIHFVLYGAGDFAILTSRDKAFFTAGGGHQARAGAQPALRLVVTKDGRLEPQNRGEASSFIREMVAGKLIKVRFRTSPGGQQDLEFQFPFLGHAYGKAVQQCGWQGVGGVSHQLPTPRIDTRNDGGAGTSPVEAWVSANPGLRLVRETSADGIDCNLTASRAGPGPVMETPPKLFGRHSTGWRYAPHPLPRRLVVRDAAGQISFSTVLPAGAVPSAWSEAVKAAAAMWAASPYGYTVLWISEVPTQVTSLFGFRELWRWGIQACGFPPLQ